MRLSDVLAASAALYLRYEHVSDINYDIIFTGQDASIMREVARFREDVAAAARVFASHRHVSGARCVVIIVRLIYRNIIDSIIRDYHVMLLLR